MVIAEKQLDIPVVQVDLASREQHEGRFQDLNPHRTVPVLELDTGQVLTSSTAIAHYLDAVFPEPALIGTTAEEKGKVIDLDWRIENEGFLAVGEAFRNRAKSFANNALTGKYEYPQIPALVDRGGVRTVRFFEWLNELLATGEYVAGDRFSLADITAFVTVEFAQWIKQHPAPELSHLHRWYKQVSERDSARV